MGIISFFKKIIQENRNNYEKIESPQNNSSIKIDYSVRDSIQLEKQIEDQIGTVENMEIEYVEVSTSGDERVCSMCAQFEGKIFLKEKAPKLPLCPNCSCDFLYYFKSDLPDNAVISDISDFVLPSEHVPLFYKHHQKLYEETDIHKRIRICESDLRKLPEFMKPYQEANFSPPPELACRDILPDLYMRLGKWKKAENAINKCIETGAYDSESGNNALEQYHLYKETATETLSYIEQNPGCFQRNIYKVMGYEGEKKEILKDFLRYSMLIKKVKHGNTNELYLNQSNDTQSSSTR